MLGNLLSNAAKYTPVGGTIELNVSVEPGEISGESSKVVVIDVRDNGIDSEVQPHLFELFAQSVRDNPALRGLGIGLAVAKRMVELHGGTISLHSEGQDRGTAVTRGLPILRTAVDSDVARPRDPVMLTRPARLLLVDDNRDALQALRVLLGLDGHEVATADNGPSAIRLMSEKPPEVAIIDVGMPEMDGFEVARSVRERPEFDGILLVALTGYASERTNREPWQPVSIT